MDEQEKFGPDADAPLRDIAASRARMAHASRRSVWHLVLLAVGYSLPFFVAGQEAWMLSLAIAIGFLVVPVILARVARARTGVAGEVMSMTNRANRNQFLWAVAFALLLTGTVVLVRLFDMDAVALITGALVLLSTPFLIARVEASAVRTVGGRDSS